MIYILRCILCREAAEELVFLLALLSTQISGDEGFGCLGQLRYHRLLLLGLRNEGVLSLWLILLLVLLLLAWGVHVFLWIRRLRWAWLDVLDAHESLLLLVVEHLVAFDVAQIAHVAYVSERVVVVEASLAGPVANSFLVLFFAV